MLKGKTYRSREQEYQQAEEEIRHLLFGEAGHAYMADELVEKLGGEGVPVDVGSTVMWEMIGTGDLELSDDWKVSAGSPDGVAAVDS